MQNTDARAKMSCPLNGKICISGRRSDFEKDESGNSVECRWWVHLYGKDPQSEKILDQHDCSLAWMPVIGTEGAQMTRQATSTIQEFRNETNEGLNKMGGAIKQAAMAFNEMATTQREMLEAVPLPSLENKEGNGHAS